MTAAARAGLSGSEEKHAIRLNDWLPRCEQRLALLQEADPEEISLRYFTLGADPLDVLLLFDEKLLASDDTGLASVHFFVTNAGDPQPHIRELPGARCFGGSFVETVLANEDPAGDPETSEYNRLAIRATTRKRFRQFFPFDVMNFDWEDLLLDASRLGELRVGEMLRTLFEWQAQAGDGDGELGGFTIGLAAALPSVDECQPEFRACLLNEIERNLKADPSLSDTLDERAGVRDVAELSVSNWNCVLDLGIPKLIMSALRDTGWALQQYPSLQIIHHSTADGGPVLHLLLDVVSCPDGDDSWYQEAVHSVFMHKPMLLEISNVGVVRQSYNKLQRLRDRLRNGREHL